MITLKIALKEIRDALSKLLKRVWRWWSKNWFYTTLIAVAVIGGVCAFLVVPFAVPQPFSKDDSISALRQAVLVATGGVLAILTLWENRRKNDQEHMRQVHAERRARYAKAVEQLADDKSAIRLGGVYTLAKLVDDWLDDEKTLPSMEKRCQEGQIIIDSLCAYIRSSFPLAERHDELTLNYEEYQQKYQDNQGKNQATQSVENSVDNSTPKAEHQDNKQSHQSREEFVRDKSLFREEQEVRQTILSEIKKQLNSGEVERENGNHEIEPGTWSYFKYDFSKAVFFYHVGFRNSYFGASLNFSEAEFAAGADFSRAKFTKGTDIYWCTDFSRTKFTRYASFSEAEFAAGANFPEAEFTGNADFSEAEFTGNANFPEAEFAAGADFSWAEFTRKARFGRAEFAKGAKFFEATFEYKPEFEYTLDNKTYKARFSSKANPEDYNFKVSYDSPYKIETEEQKHNGIKFIIPKGTELFDPDKSYDLEDNEDI